ncbi:MAG TPA: hypothetical protein VH458_12340 [Vicinamibacterales bacterium]|jgi:hypothetical protein
MVDLFNPSLTPDEEEAVAAFMQRVAVVPDAELPPLADPTVLWWRAQLVRRWESERRVQAPLDVFEPIQIAAGLVAAGLLFVWTLPSLARALSFIHL